MDKMIEQSITPAMGTTVANRTTVGSKPAASTQPAVESRTSWFAFFVAVLKEAIRVRVAPETATTRKIQSNRDVLDVTMEPIALLPHSR
jgi:hypothetical protein